MAKYLSASIHYLSKTEADAYKDRYKDLCEIWDEKDGTFSVHILSLRPIQVGQPEWIGSSNAIWPIMDEPNLD
jgi:hypothetical protein